MSFYFIWVNFFEHYSILDCGMAQASRVAELVEGNGLNIDAAVYPVNIQGDEALPIMVVNGPRIASLKVFRVHVGRIFRVPGQYFFDVLDEVPDCYPPPDFVFAVFNSHKVIAYSKLSQFP